MNSDGPDFLPNLQKQASPLSKQNGTTLLDKFSNIFWTSNEKVSIWQKGP